MVTLGVLIIFVVLLFIQNRSLAKMLKEAQRKNNLCENCGVYIKDHSSEFCAGCNEYMNHLD